DENGVLTHIVSFLSSDEKHSIVLGPHNAKIDNWGQIFDCISQPVFILNRDYTIIYANAAALVLEDTTKQSILQKKCYHVMHQKNVHLKTSPFADAVSFCKESHAKMLVETL